MKAHTLTNRKEAQILALPKTHQANAKKGTDMSIPVAILSLLGIVMGVTALTYFALHGSPDAAMLIYPA